MKQYKLKQKYPSLPSDWEVGMEVGQGDRGSCGDYSPIHGKYSNRYINACEVHNNPEFWEEVVFKDYEILSFYSDDEISKRIKGDSFECFERDRLRTVEIFAGITLKQIITSCSEDYMLKSYKIHSVKYLPTGEIFTVGDTARTIGKFPHKIESIKIMQKQINRVTYDGVDRIWLTWKNDGGGNWLESTEKVKPVIFQSFDGENVVQGQPYYAVTKDFQLAYCSFYSEHDLDMKLFAKKENAQEYIKTYKDYKTTDGERIVEGQTFYVYEDKFFKCIKTSFGNFTSDKWAEKRFKTKEEVKELILMNKPCLSLNDIKKFSNATVYEIVVNNLKEFAKNKIEK